MSVTRIGATKQYSDGWDNIFGGGRSTATKKSATAKAKKKSPKAKPAKKTATAKPKKAARKKKR